MGTETVGAALDATEADVPAARLEAAAVKRARLPEIVARLVRVGGGSLTVV